MRFVKSLAVCLWLVAQLVEALPYKPEDRGFDSRVSLEFFIDIILPAALWLWGRLSFLQKRVKAAGA